MKVVITGGPCTGKTTLINELASKGYTIVPEAARIVIGQLNKENKSSLENIADIQTKILRKQIELESNYQNSLTFFDRSGIDTIAYCKFYNMKNTPEIEVYSQMAKFDRIFFLAPVCNFHNDDVRYETAENGSKIHNLIREVYEELGYRITDLPAIPPKERADFILQEIFGGKHGR